MENRTLLAAAGIAAAGLYLHSRSSNGDSGPEGHIEVVNREPHPQNPEEFDLVTFEVIHPFEEADYTWTVTAKPGDEELIVGDNSPTMVHQSLQGTTHLIRCYVTNGAGDEVVYEHLFEHES